MAQRIKSAKKMARFPNYKKRANSKINTVRVANRFIRTLSDTEIKKVHQNASSKTEFINHVVQNLPPTRQTKKFLEQNPNLILIMGQEAFTDRKYLLLIFFISFEYFLI